MEKANLLKDCCGAETAVARTGRRRSTGAFSDERSFRKSKFEDADLDRNHAAHRQE
jgi:hypothetical protein